MQEQFKFSQDEITALLGKALLAKLEAQGRTFVSAHVRYSFSEPGDVLIAPGEGYTRITAVVTPKGMKTL